MSGEGVAEREGDESPPTTEDSGDQWGIDEILEDSNAAEVGVEDAAQALGEEIRNLAEDTGGEVDSEIDEEDESESEPAEFESWAENQFEEEPVDTSEEEASWMDDSENEEMHVEEVGKEEVIIEPNTKVETISSPAEGLMILGTRRDDGSEVAIPSTILARHAAMLGSTGSGKTVMAKALIEEATLAGIPSLILDPQGDLARLALGLDENELNEQGGDVSRRNALMEKAEVRIWTPLRSKGLPICIDPFVAPPAELGMEEAITAWDMVAAGFTGLADYDVEKAQGKQVKPFIYEILVHGTRLGLPLDCLLYTSPSPRD